MEHRKTTPGENGEHGRGFMSRVRERASEQLNAQKDQAGEGIGSAAQAVRQSTQRLRDERHDTVAHYIESAADQLDRLANRLKGKNITELFDDAQRFARRQPALFVGSAFALGLLGSRFLKSSDPDGDANQKSGDRDYSRTHFAGPFRRPDVRTPGSGRYLRRAGHASDHGHRGPPRDRHRDGSGTTRAVLDKETD
jgi:hypothetical protein